MKKEKKGWLKAIIVATIVFFVFLNISYNWIIEAEISSILERNNYEIFSQQKNANMLSELTAIKERNRILSNFIFLSKDKEYLIEIIEKILITAQEIDLYLLERDKSNIETIDCSLQRDLAIKAKEIQENIKEVERAYINFESSISNEKLKDFITSFIDFRNIIGKDLVYLRACLN